MTFSTVPVSKTFCSVLAVDWFAVSVVHGIYAGLAEFGWFAFILFAPAVRITAMRSAVKSALLLIHGLWRNIRGEICNPVKNNWLGNNLFSVNYVISIIFVIKYYIPVKR